MIVYVESNFILELAYQQEEHESCGHILTAAQQGGITLALPAFCLGETYESWVRRSRERRALHEQLTRELKQLARSQTYNTLLRDSSAVTRALISSGEEEKQRLDRVIISMTDVAAIIPLARETIQQAIPLQASRSLSPQDAIVYSSILAHMSSAPGQPKCFLTRNSRDFANPDVEQDLQRHDCKLLTKFINGLDYIRGRMEPHT